MPEEFHLWVKTPEECIQAIQETKKIDLISFDHDLGGDLTAIPVAEYLEAGAYHKTLPKIQWKIHSMNPIGRKNLERILKRADRFWNGDMAP